MFSTSSQLKFWTFSGTTEINHLRAEVNNKFIQAQIESRGGKKTQDVFLTPDDETLIRRHYEYVIKEFCQKFQPPMPRYVLGTSIAYMKRFYLHNSVMDYHPKDIVHTCVYLASKVEEFNVSVTQFVNNLPGDQDMAADIILSQELLLMQQLHYHLTIHNPYRPLEGLFIDVKTRCSDVDDAEKLRPLAEDFLDKTLHTDVSLIFAPSQIALAALLHSASRNGCSLDSYIANKLMSSGSNSKDNLLKTVEHIKRIKFMVKSLDKLDREEVRRAEVKLEQCRNQENNPYSDEFRQRQEDLFEEEEDRQLKKRLKVAEEERRAERALTGV